MIRMARYRAVMPAPGRLPGGIDPVSSQVGDGAGRSESGPVGEGGPQQVGQYRVSGRIGRGGMATVYRARHLALGRDVALKVLPAFFSEDPRFRERFRREAMAIAKLRHPNVVTVHDAGEADGVLYIATELVEGGTLADRLGAPVPAGEAAALLRPIADALDHAHGEGVLHRDVKPSNILIARDGRPLLADFGLARILAEDVALRTATGVGVGTPEYMAPEHAGGVPVGPAADEYSLATIAYQMVTGRLPYGGATAVEVLGSQLRGALPLPRTVNPSVPLAVQDVLVRALARDPRRRYPSASAFVDALAGAATARPSARATVRWSASALLGTTRRRMAAAVAVTAAVAMVAGAIVLRPPDPVVVSGPAIAEKASLFHTVRFDASGEYMGIRETEPDAASASVRTETGALELAVSRPGGRAHVGLLARHPPTYVAEISVTLDLGSPQDIFVWQLYRSGATYHALVVTGEEMHLSFTDEREQRQGRVLSKAAVESELRRKRSTISIAFSGSRYTAYIDGSPILSFEDTRGPEGTFDFSVSGGRASATITALRIYLHAAAGTR